MIAPADLSTNDPRRFLPFGDPAYAPDWVAEDRPEWLTKKDQFPAFRDFCLCQLDELDRRANEMTGEQFAALARALAGANFAPTVAVLQSFDDAGISWTELEKRKRRVATGRVGESGPTVADPAERAMLPVARAAMDMAKVRYVIVPRFWPPRKNLPSPWLEMIAAERNKCSPTAARSWFKNNGLPEAWRMN